MDEQTLADPAEEAVTCRVQEGQEEQDPVPDGKQELEFPSGETLPRCWIDANYRSAN